jgi:hypothetical protein
MSEMVERCTDALLRAFYSRPVEEQHMSITAQDHYDLVLAVLREAREPTVPMLNAIENVVLTSGYDDAPFVLEESAMDAWHNAINEALK